MVKVISYKASIHPKGLALRVIQGCKEEGLICFSTPFDFTAVDFLEKLNVPLYKIAFVYTDIPLIDYIAAKDKPIILSTGIATEQDIY